MAATIEAKDVYTRGHSLRVARYAAAVARKMNLPGEKVEEIHTAGVLHDTGKIGVPGDILLKPGKLTLEERKQMEVHPVIGVKILEPAGFSPDVITAVRHHHENTDGSGYPGGLKGSEVPLGARILRVADTFDAMTSDRPYRKRLPLGMATAELQKNAGTQFDSDVVRAFLELIEEDGD